MNYSLHEISNININKITRKNFTAWRWYPVGMSPKNIYMYISIYNPQVIYIASSYFIRSDPLFEAILRDFATVCYLKISRYHIRMTICRALRSYADLCAVVLNIIRAYSVSIRDQWQRETFRFHFSV